MKEELKEIEYIVSSIIEDANETGRTEEAHEALTAYRVLGQMIKDRLIGDLIGSRQSREFKLCRDKLRIEVIYEPVHKV